MNLRQFLAIVELRTKIVSVSGLLVGSLAAGLSGAVIHWPALAVMWLASLAVDMGTTAFNSFFGFWDGSDHRRFNRETDKVLVHEALPPALALAVGLALFAAAAILGLWLCALTGWWLLPIGVACLAVGFLYNGGPLPIARTPLGELFAGGFLGWLLPVLTALVATGGPDYAAPSAPLMLMALPSFLFVAAILSVNNACDREGDRHAGRLTLSILIGPRASRFLILLLGLGAWLAAAACCLWGWLSAWSIIPLGLGFALGLPGWRAMDHRGYSHATKGPSMGSISRLFLIFSLSLGAAMVLSLIA